MKALNNLLFARYGITLNKLSTYLMKDYAIELLLGGHDSWQVIQEYVKSSNNTTLVQ